MHSTDRMPTFDLNWGWRPVSPAIHQAVADMTAELHTRALAAGTPIPMLSLFAADNGPAMNRAARRASR